MKNCKQIFESLPLPALLLEWKEDTCVIYGINRAFTTAIGKHKKEFIGKCITEILPENPDQHGTNWEQIFPSLHKVRLSGKAHSIKIVRFDILNEDIDEYIERYWQIENVPIKDELSGKVIFIQTIIIEKTSEVLDRKRRQELETALSSKSEKESQYYNRLADYLSHPVKTDPKLTTKAPF